MVVVPYPLPFHLNSQPCFLLKNKLKVHNLPPDQLAKREVIMVDIANDPIDERVSSSHSLSPPQQ